jgi:hypothetical protein
VFPDFLEADPALSLLITSVVALQLMASRLQQSRLNTTHTISRLQQRISTPSEQHQVAGNRLTVVNQLAQIVSVTDGTVDAVKQFLSLRFLIVSSAYSWVN